MKTIKQIANEIGVSKQRVYRFIKDNCIKDCINDAHHEAHQKHITKYYDDAAQTLIKSHFLKFDAHQNGNDVHHDVHHEAHHDTPKTASPDTRDAVIDTLVSMLKHELEIKNKQIEELTAIVRTQAESINTDRNKVLADTLIDGQKVIADKEVRNRRSWQFWKK